MGNLKRSCPPDSPLIALHFTAHSLPFTPSRLHCRLSSSLSSTAVGYSTININKEYTLLTVNFDDVTGEALDIQKAFPYTEGMTKGLTVENGDNIQIMTASGDYEIYFLSNGASVSLTVSLSSSVSPASTLTV